MKDSEVWDEILDSFNEDAAITRDLMEKMHDILSGKPMIPCLQALLQMTTASFIHNGNTIEKLHEGIDIYYKCYREEMADVDTGK